MQQFSTIRYLILFVWNKSCVVTETLNVMKNKEIVQLVNWFLAEAYVSSAGAGGRSGSAKQSRKV